MKLSTPSSAHAFLDESKHSSYVTAVAVVAAPDLAATRRTLRHLLLPGQSALHFKDEQEGRRRLLIKAMCRLNVHGGVYISSSRPQSDARQYCLRAVVRDLAGMQAERLVLELADGDLAADRQTLFRAVREAKVEGTLRYDHLRAPAEPMLWVADALAWGWSHGGQWRDRLQPLIRLVTEA